MLNAERSSSGFAPSSTHESTSVFRSSDREAGEHPVASLRDDLAALARTELPMPWGVRVAMGVVSLSVAALFVKAIVLIVRVSPLP